MVDADDDSEYGFFRRLFGEGGCDVEIGASSFTNANANTTSIHQVTTSRGSVLLVVPCVSHSP